MLLRRFELSSDEWEAIRIVSLWLATFQQATTIMSSSKASSSLSQVLAAFLGLRDSIVHNMEDIPQGTHEELRRGLVEARGKLTDYLTKLSSSPYYMWAASA
jgi:hypothetical protein